MTSYTAGQKRGNRFGNIRTWEQFGIPGSVIFGPTFGIGVIGVSNLGWLTSSTDVGTLGGIISGMGLIGVICRMLAIIHHGRR